MNKQLKSLCVGLSIICALSIILTAITSCRTTEPQNATELAKIEYIKITPYEAKLIIESEPHILLDVRTEQEFDDQHIEGAILIPYDELGGRAKSELPNKDDVILIYCRSGRRSEIAARELIEFGYTNVFDFGGILDWEFGVYE